MLSKTDDGHKRIEKYLLENATPEVKIPKDEKKDIKETPKNDDFNEYEENDKDPLEDKNMDDREW